MRLAATISSGLSLDSFKHVLLHEGKTVPLPPKAVEVLLMLVAHNGCAMTKDELLHAIWPNTVVEESNLTQYVFLLRKALGERRDGARYILTLPGVGYRFRGRRAPNRGHSQSVLSHALATGASLRFPH